MVVVGRLCLTAILLVDRLLGNRLANAVVSFRQLRRATLADPAVHANVHRPTGLSLSDEERHDEDDKAKDSHLLLV